MVVETWVCDVPEFHVGDTWRFVSFLLLRSQELGLPVAGDFRNSGVESLAQAILAELEPIGRVQFVRAAHGASRCIWDMVPTVPARLRWFGDRGRRRFAYQFDGISNAASKNPLAAEVETFLEAMAQWGFEAVPLGRHLGIHGSCLAARDCSFFVGCCSGMAQLVYSVGVPAVILRYRQTRIEMARWHSGKALGIALGLGDFMARWLPVLSARVRADGSVQECVWPTVHQPAD